MKASHWLRFTHRRYADQAFDPICKCCLRTFATHASDSDLGEEEGAHTCAKEDLGRSLHQVGATFMGLQLDAMLRSWRPS